MQYNKNSGISKSIRMKLRCIGAAITRLFYTFPADEPDKPAHGFKGISTPLFYSLLSLFLGLSKINTGSFPFGLSIIISSFGRNAAFAFTGAALSTLFQGYKGAVQFICFFLIFLLRKNISKDEFNESINTRLITVLIASSFIGLCTVFSESFSFQAIISLITYIILSVISTYLFSGSLNPSFKKSSSSLFITSVYSICVCLMPAFTRLSTIGIDFSVIFASVITLWICGAKGPVFGCVCGFIMGFACTNPLFSAPFGLSGLVCGYLFGKSTYLAIFAFCACSTLSGIYILASSSISAIMPFTFIASLLYFLIRNRIPDVFSDKTIKANDSHKEKTKSNEFNKVSDTLSGLSSIIYKFAEHLKAPGNTETGAIFDNALSEICSSCSMNSMCYAKRECNIQSVKNKIISILHTGPLKEEKLSEMFLSKCIKTREMCQYINAHYSELNFVTMRSNRTQTVACLYNSMSHLIKTTTKADEESKIRDEKLECLIGNALKSIGVEFSHVSVKGTRQKDIFVHGIKADKIPCSSKDLSDYLSGECRIKLSEPSFDISDNADLVMKFTRGEILSLEYAQCCESKSSDDVNGDTVCLFDSDKGYFYSIIADGMGSGKAAAATSRLSCVFMEKMLTSGIAKNVCLEMLNNLLLSKNDETFSTIDMLEIDKLNGSAYFIKAGAAPSFILRRNHLYKIASETPPVGIIPAFSAESTRFSLEKGDIIFMVSDGVMQSDSDAVWLSELIHMNSVNEPALLASELIEKSKSINLRKDDASACVIKII